MWQLSLYLLHANIRLYVPYLKSPFCDLRTSKMVIICSSSSRRQICKARLHTKVSQMRLLPYVHSNSSRVLALRMFEERPFQVEGPGTAAAKTSCQCAGDDKVAVIGRPQTWSCHRVHTSRRYFRHRPWWQSNVISTILKVTRCYWQPVQSVSEYWRDVVALTDTGDHPCGRLQLLVYAICDTIQKSEKIKFWGINAFFSR